ncbi:hypothetical protein [Variovorax boronicumulans]|uniref:hypothetical protein n=1 Tax=Variovorax boronicumulans TaxID=436515 RepID=UPI001C57132B
MTYTVALIDFPELPSDERRNAEQRYGLTLEEELGGAAQVRPKFTAYMRLAQAPEDEPTPMQAKSAVQYLMAQHRAEIAGFSGLQPPPQARFILRLDGCV